MKLYITLSLIILSTLSITAQNGIIKGRVYNSKTNEPIEFANIIILGTTIGSTSDLDGNFLFTNITPGFLKLVVSSVGFETTVSSEIQVQGNQTSFTDIAINESPFQIQEVVVKQNLNIKRIESPISVLSVGVQEIEKGAGSNRDISKVIQTLPGVGSTDPNRNDLIVRGGGPSENVFYLDGIEIPVINHFSTQGSSGGSVGIINPDFVREINFYTGAFPASRQNALSSVMEIKQKDGSKDRVHGKFSIGASDAAITVDGPIGNKSSFIASARQSYLQFLFKAIGLPFLPTYNDFQFKYKYQINKKHELNFIGLGAIDDMTLNTELEETGTEAQKYILSFLPVYKQWNYTVGLNYKYFGKKHVNNWILSRNMLRNTNFKYLNNDETLNKLSDYASDEAENKFRFEQTSMGLNFKLQWGGGIKYAHYTNNTEKLFFSNGTTNTLKYNTTINLWGYQAFVQVSDEYFSDLLKLSFGINTNGLDFNDNMRNPINQLSPRLSASYKLTEKTNLNANLGRYTLQPSYTTLGYREETEGPLANQNENLTYTYSNQGIIGIEYEPADKMRFAIEGFIKEYSNYPISINEGISTASKGTEFGQIGDELIASTGKGRAYGVEIQSKISEMKGFNLFATYTFFRSEFTDINGIYRPSSWDTKHLFNIISSYKLQKNWNIAARWRFVGGSPYTPIDLNKSSLISAWNITNLPYLDYSQYNSKRLPASHQLDIRIDKEFYFKKLVFNVYTDIQNVYNFKTPSTPIYTNREASTGNPVIDPNDPTRYVLRSFESFGGTILPTIGIIIKI